MKSKEITIIAILAALYNAIGFWVPMFSFGPAQCRISDALYPLISVFGMPGVIGLTLGHLIYNTYGFITGFALGWGDIFISVPLFIFPKLAIYKFGWKATIIHVLFVAFWVPTLLCFHVPEIPWIAYQGLFVSIGLGEAIAELGLGLPLMKAVKSRWSFM